MVRRNSSKNSQPALKPAELSILPTVKAMGRKMIKDGGNEDDRGADPLEYYGTWFMEDMSEAGYSETSEEDRTSCCAFTNLLRIKAATCGPSRMPWATRKVRTISSWLSARR